MLRRENRDRRDTERPRRESKTELDPKICFPAFWGKTCLPYSSGRARTIFGLSTFGSGRFGPSHSGSSHFGPSREISYRHRREISYRHRREILDGTRSQNNCSQYFWEIHFAVFLDGPGPFLARALLAQADLARAVLGSSHLARPFLAVALFGSSNP